MIIRYNNNQIEVFCTFTYKTCTYNTHKTYSQTCLCCNYSKTMFPILRIWNLWIKIWNTKATSNVIFLFSGKKWSKNSFSTISQNMQHLYCVRAVYFACMIMKVNNLSKKLQLLIEIVIDKIIPYMLCTI